MPSQRFINGYPNEFDNAGRHVSDFADMPITTEEYRGEFTTPKARAPFLNFEMDPQERADRQYALSEANKFMSARTDPHVIVAAAEAFLTFLQGKSRELIEAEIRKAFEDRGIPYDQKPFEDGEGTFE